MVRLHGACASCMGPNRVLFLEIEAHLAVERNGVEYLETCG
jgi:Fe-S cluster biogenesis protein NfuA